MAELRDWEVELVVLGMAEEQWEEEGERVEVEEREEEGDTENKGVLEFATSERELRGANSRKSSRTGGAILANYDEKPFYK